VDTLWSDRPALPADPVFIHDVRFAGLSAAEKISSALADANASLASSIFVSALDEIAWCLNIRSTDVRRNPVATAFLYLSPSSSTLFINPDKLSPEVTAHLAEARVDVAPYDSVLPFLSALPADARVLADFNTTASIVISTLASRAVNAPSPLAMLKGVKNEVEQQGFRQAMIRDGVALVRSFMEIEQRVATGKHITEIGVADILTHYRSQQDLCFDDSFDTICGYADHGAIVHYSATPETDATLAPDGLLLVDSGAQYFDGTTDITRTISLGNPTDLQRRDFTLVLKGNIALDMAVFPVGTRGIQIDILAHQFLWKAGLNYFHGTGHGVGHFLNVHEGPHTVRNNGNMVPLRPGMILTDEPGLYREGLHGVRCENMLLIVPAFTTEFGEFYRFETLTLFPFDRRLIDLSLLTPDERRWIDNYHAVVFQRLSPHLDDEEKAWLAAATAPLA
ncbi:MAG: aminopeptidase P family protein, partial [Muribaculaceae bacterium]|nr:aminopeptidase P family protein [Muribaculaceae bacterium]